MEEPKHKTKANKNLVKPLGMLAVVVVIAGLAFYGGVQYQKNHAPSPVATQAGSPVGSGFGAGGGRFGGANRVVGSVTAISTTSISVQNARSGSDVTLAITSSTQISNNGQTATTADIKVGDNVFVTEDSSNTSQATRILLNPSFGGGGPQQPATTN